MIKIGIHCFLIVSALYVYHLLKIDKHMMEINNKIGSYSLYWLLELGYLTFVGFLYFAMFCRYINEDDEIVEN